MKVRSLWAKTIRSPVIRLRPQRRSDRFAVLDNEPDSKKDGSLNGFVDCFLALEDRLFMARVLGTIGV